MFIYTGTNCLPYLEEMLHKEDKIFPDYFIDKAVISEVIKQKSFISVCVRSNSDLLMSFLGAKITTINSVEEFAKGKISEEEFLLENIEIDRNGLVVYISSFVSLTLKSSSIGNAFASMFAQLDEVLGYPVAEYFAAAGTKAGARFMKRVGFLPKPKSGPHDMFFCNSDEVFRKIIKYDPHAFI